MQILKENKHYNSVNDMPFDLREGVLTALASYTRISNAPKLKDVLEDEQLAMVEAIGISDQQINSAVPAIYGDDDEFKWVANLSPDTPKTTKDESLWFRMMQCTFESTKLVMAGFEFDIINEDTFEPERRVVTEMQIIPMHVTANCMVRLDLVTSETMDGAPVPDVERSRYHIADVKIFTYVHDTDIKSKLKKY